MCAGCFIHLLADSRLKEEQATCPNCRCEISKSLCCRNLAVEKAVSELPAECGFCARQFPRSLLERHQKEECQDRVTQCKYKRIGCPWQGPFHELSVHESECAHPAKTGNELMEILDEMDQSRQKEMQLYNSIFSLLSFEKIGYTGTGNARIPGIPKNSTKFQEILMVGMGFFGIFGGFLEVFWGFLKVSSACSAWRRSDTPVRKTPEFQEFPGNSQKFREILMVPMGIFGIFLGILKVPGFPKVFQGFPKVFQGFLKVSSACSAWRRSATPVRETPEFREFPKNPGDFDGSNGDFWDFFRDFLGFLKVLQGFLKVLQGFPKVFQGFPKVFWGFLKVSSACSASRTSATPVRETPEFREFPGNSTKFREFLMVGMGFFLIFFRDFLGFLKFLHGSPKSFWGFLKFSGVFQRFSRVF
uniref:TRAF-type domain-containing protein n=1 Tax=Cyanistes caeruleus TaxID=156563 RepID=A0A8C0Z909_CYACU